ncbi:MAG: AAA family ATPase [Terracidiphilus sp.]|jgi:pilus assembly protein CpaE
MSTSTAIQLLQTPSIDLGDLTVAVISPDEQRREAATNALGECRGVQIREFISYPPGIENVSRMLGNNFNVVVVDLDSDANYAVDLVQSICSVGRATVIVYSSQADPDLLIRCMRAGTREYLVTPFEPGEMADALVRASALRTVVAEPKKAGGKLLVFLSAKGGSGVTTLACNYAVSLAQESQKKTLMIDLNLPLGDAAIDLGIKSQYSVINALQNASRLDAHFLSGLMVRHDSGLFVLPAPSELAPTQIAEDAIDRLLTLARQEFDYVVVDAGSRLDMQHTSLFEDSSTIFLVTQIGIPELRNSNRLITKLTSEGGPKLEIVINRYDPYNTEIDESHLKRALTRAPDWKIPNNYAAVRKMQNTATPLTDEDTQISRAIQRMTRTLCGKPLAAEKKDKKKSRFSLFG